MGCRSLIDLDAARSGQRPVKIGVGGKRVEQQAARLRQGEGEARPVGDVECSRDRVSGNQRAQLLGDLDDTGGKAGAAFITDVAFDGDQRSEEHTSELQSLMRISY